MTRFDALSLEIAGRISQLAGHLWLRHPALFTAAGRPDAVDPAALVQDLAACAASPREAAGDLRSPLIAILPEFDGHGLAALLAEVIRINETWRHAGDRRHDRRRTLGFAEALRALREPYWLLRPHDRAEAFRERFARAFLSADLARYGFPYTGGPPARLLQPAA